MKAAIRPPEPSFNNCSTLQTGVKRFAKCRPNIEKTIVILAEAFR